MKKTKPTQFLHIILWIISTAVIAHKSSLSAILYQVEKVIYLIIDYYYDLLGKLLMFFHKNPPKHYLGYVVKDKTPIILIPGISNKWGFLKRLGDSVSHLGHPVYVVDKLGFNLLDIPTSTKLVREIVDQNNLKNAVIVGHSKGGLIGKYFLLHENTDNRIKGVIAIASPFSGSRIVHHLPGKSFKELAPESKIIKSMDSSSKMNSKIISVMPEFDNHVWSEKGSYLDGALNIRFAIKGHHKIIFDKAVIRKVIELIGKFK